MIRGIMVAAVIALAIAVIPQLDAGRAHADGHTLQLTVRNITQAQPITPPLVVTHTAEAVLLPSSAERLEGLEELAEAGLQSPLMETLAERSGVKSVSRFGGIITPGNTATIQGIEADPGDHVTVIGMFACTNDAIVVATAVIGDEGTLPAFGAGRVLDAGTEENSETSGTIPCLSGEAVSFLDTADGEGTIQPHPGIAGTADLDETRGWDYFGMQIIVAERGTDIPQPVEAGLTVSNRTKGQPFSPPLVVVHDPNVDVLDYSRPSELDGIDDLAEGGATDDLRMSLLSRPGVISIASLGSDGPIAPGTSFAGSVSALEGSAVSVVGMLVCTNDGYFRGSVHVNAKDGVVEQASDSARVFDSGSEINEETSATVPCLGGTPFSPGIGEGSRSVHPGITGTGDLTVARHGWIPEGVATIVLHGSGGPSAGAGLPSTGGYAPNNSWMLTLGAIGLIVALAGFVALIGTRRVREED